MYATYWRDTGVLEVAGTENDSSEVVLEVQCDENRVGDVLEKYFGENWSAIPLDFEDGGDAFARQFGG